MMKELHMLSAKSTITHRIVSTDGIESTALQVIWLLVIRSFCFVFVFVLFCFGLVWFGLVWFQSEFRFDYRNVDSSSFNCEAFGLGDNIRRN